MMPAEVLRKCCGGCGGCGSAMLKCLKSFNAEVLRKCGGAMLKSLINMRRLLRAEVPHTPIATSAGAETLLRRVL